MGQNKKIILLSGPTSSGKSKLAVKIAQYLNGEIVNEMNRVRGFLVEEITQNQVKLERNDYQVTLNLEE